MKASELRIGNKFLSAFGNVETVLSITDNTDRGSIEFVSDDHRDQYSHIICCEENRNQYKPIEIKGVPLTEEWLLKFGFENESVPDCYIYKTLIPSGKLVFAGLKKNDGFSLQEIHGCDNDGEYATIFSINSIQYVHQLQNLYYALTGKELEIKVAQPA